MALALRRFYPELEAILPPGTLEGGDVMRAGNRFFIGVSARSNEEGARQFAAIVSRCGFEAIPVPLREVLHLKTGVSYLENNLLLDLNNYGSPDPNAWVDRVEGTTTIVYGTQEDTEDQILQHVGGHLRVADGHSAKTREVGVTVPDYGLCHVW